MFVEKPTITIIFKRLLLEKGHQEYTLKKEQQSILPESAYIVLLQVERLNNLKSCETQVWKSCHI